MYVHTNGTYYIFHYCRNVPLSNWHSITNNFARTMYYFGGTNTHAFTMASYYNRLLKGLVRDHGDSS